MSKFIVKLVVLIALPLLLILSGVGLVVLGRVTDSGLLTLAGLIVGGIGVLTALVSAVVSGIDIFDL